MTSTATTESPTPTTPSSKAPTRASSRIDLTQPIINSNAAQEANRVDLDSLDIQSEASSSDFDSSDNEEDRTSPATGIVTVRGVEPSFGPEHIVSERVSTHGKIRPFEPVNAVPALDPALRETIGQIHAEGAIKKWSAKRKDWDEKYGKDLEKFRRMRREDRAEAEKDGFLTRQLHGERPPLASLAGLHDRSLARDVGRSVDEIGKKTSGAMLIWNRMSTKASSDNIVDDVFLTRRLIGNTPAVMTWMRSGRMWRKSSRRRNLKDYLRRARAGDPEVSLDRRRPDRKSDVTKAAIYVYVCTQPKTHCDTLNARGPARSAPDSRRCPPHFLPPARIKQAMLSL